MAKSNEPESSSLNLVGTGTSITGEIIANGDIRIDGQMKGNLSTKGKLVVGPTGSIIGDVVCRNSDVFGKIEGTVKVTELLALKETSRIEGDIAQAKLSIEPGAIFTGRCTTNTSGMGTKEPKKGR